MARFDDKVAFITGAAAGIGQATAVRLASEGASVFVTDVNEAGLQDTVKQCTEPGSQAAYQVCDVSDEDQVNRAVKACRDQFGKLNVLCNNAGIIIIEKLEDTTVDQFHRVMNINLLGTWLHCKAAMPHLIESGGNIVNVASTAAVCGNAYQSLYCASKGGLTALTRGLQVEFGQQGVRVNSVLPGAIGTAMMQPDFPEAEIDLDLLMRRLPMREPASPAEVASAIAWVASDDASYIYGDEIRIDGGMLS